MADDPREPYGRIFHEQGRFPVNAEREKPFGVGKWEDRTDEQREIDMRGASAVAAQAVADAGLGNERMKAQLFALTAHRPAIFDALNIILRMPELYESQKKRYRAALKALGGVEEDGSDA
jgi:hypothetical protein